MPGARFAPKERLQMYIEALNHYVEKLAEYAQKEGPQSIVFAENSDYDEMLIMQHVRKHPQVEVEYLNIGSRDFQISLGKGYNEFLLLHKTLEQSETIRKYGRFFKLTGRLKVQNIGALLNECDRRNYQAGGNLQFLADCKDHNLYAWLHLPINGHAGECRYWYASVKFFNKMFVPKYHYLNDYSTPPILAEDLMLRVCRETRGQYGCFDRFKTQARISGKGAHSLGKGWSFFYSTDNDSLTLRLKCAIRQCLRWVIPGWRV